MAVIAKNQILAPFLSTKLKHITGQDPMGMLNIGEQVFSMMLPGLNNVTERIRYYSFYCWFFDWYAKEIGSENPKELYKYVRRAEYLLALIAAKIDESGIAGITEAKKNYDPSKKEFSLKVGTGENKDNFENTYWKNARGVFGQNYVTSLRTIGLIRDKEQDSNLYIRTAFAKENVVSGKELAIAFTTNLINGAHETFKKALHSATVSQDDLEILQESFNMKKVPVRTKENQLLLKMLLGNDSPLSNETTTYRNKTTMRYLQLMHEKKSSLTVLEFIQYAYEKQGFINAFEDETLTAWYYYQLSQYWHVINTGGLMHVLTALQEKSDGSWYVESSLIEELSTVVVAELTKMHNFDASQPFNKLPVLDIDNNRLSVVIKTTKYDLGLTNAFLLLQKIVSENKSQIARLKVFAKEHQLESTSDFVAQFNTLENLSTLPVHEFVSKYIKKYIIDRHQLVSFNKITNSQTSEKFIREDGLIRFIDYINFDFSNPRLGNLIDFYIELGIISDDKNTLTEKGVELLKTLEAND